MTNTQNTPETETPEQKALRESRVQAEREASGSKGGILESIMGFLKFLWESFFPSKDAPDEDPEKPRKPVSSAEMARLGKLIIDKKAIPNWKSYQEAHSGEKVEHTNPVRGGFREITRDMGRHIHPIKGTVEAHDGVDLKARNPNPEILASADGVVLFAGDKSGYGNTVIIGHKDGSWTLYAHMLNKPDENMIGTKVAQGEVIGVMGASGGSVGAHLHYEQGQGDKRVIPRIAEVGLLKDGVEYAAAPDKPNPLAALVDRDKHIKYPVGGAQEIPKARPIIMAAAKTNPHAGHGHD